jgi:membrane protease subunit HflK
MRKIVPGGFGSSFGASLVVLVVFAFWVASGIFNVQPNELGVVLRFGEFVRQAYPGINYHLPWPIETVLKPSVTNVYTLDIGFRSASDPRTPRLSSVPAEGLMLTGDENIIEVQYTVFWQIKDAGQFLFNIASQDTTVKAAAESAMREVVGQESAQFALAEGRGQIETRAARLMQQILDHYQSGITISRVQLRAVDPPAQVIDAFRDVQRAKANREQLRNEAEAFRNDIVPRARGDAERLKQEAEGYRQQVIDLAKGEAQRFISVYDAYKLAPEVTKQRLYLETMEQVMRGSNKIIMDQQPGTPGVLPYLPLDAQRRPPAPGTPTQPQIGAQR